jgi:integrase
VLAVSLDVGSAGVAVRAALQRDPKGLLNSSLAGATFAHAAGVSFLFSATGEYLDEVNSWQLHLAGRTASLHTRRTRSSAVKAALRWFELHDLRWQDCTELAHINLMRVHYRDVVALAPHERAAGVHERKPRVSKRTWNQWMTHWYQFLSYAQRKRWIEDIGFELWQAKQTGKSAVMIRALRPEEFRQFSSAAPTQRFRAGLMTLVGTGIRTAELNALRNNDVPTPTQFGGEGYLPRTITGKGDKAREIFWPLSAAKVVHAYQVGERRLAVEVLKAAVRRGEIALDATYLRRANPDQEASDLVEMEGAPLWLTEDGLPLSYKRWGREFEAVSLASGVRATPHWMRHTYAIVTLSMLIKQQIRQEIIDTKLGVQGQSVYFRNPVDEVRLRLGHASIETTMIYLDHIAEHRHLLKLAIADLENMYIND